MIVQLLVCSEGDFSVSIVDAKEELSRDERSLAIAHLRENPNHRLRTELIWEE